MHGKLQGTKRLTAIALLLTVAFILSWLEMILSFPMAVPGIKIGLANLAILFTLYYCGAGDALFVLTGRLVLNAVLFGNASSLIFSAAGGFLSFIVMCVCKRLFGRHIVYVSIFGGVFHNIGQLIAASIVLSTPFAAYAPYLIIGGIAAGFFNGIVVSRLLKSRPFRRDDEHSDGEAENSCDREESDTSHSLEENAGADKNE